MKRSEAINLIVDKINEDQYQDYQVEDYQVSAALELLESRVRISYPVPFGVWARLDKDDPEYDIRTMHVVGWEPEDG